MPTRSMLAATSSGRIPTKSLLEFGACQASTWSASPVRRYSVLTPQRGSAVFIIHPGAFCAYLGIEEHMRRQWSLYLLALSFALGATLNVFGEGPTFTTIDFPGAESTQTWAINARGEIVGFYTSAGVTH